MADEPTSHRKHSCGNYMQNVWPRDPAGVGGQQTIQPIWYLLLTDNEGEQNESDWEWKRA